MLKKKLLGLASLDRTIAQQRSRLLHLRVGEANTDFFHRHACHRQRKNTITTLQHDGTIFTGQDEITGVMDRYYANVFGRAPARVGALHLDMLDLPSFDLAHLEAPFSEEEVVRTIRSMPLDKAP